MLHLNSGPQLLQGFLAPVLKSSGMIPILPKYQTLISNNLSLIRNRWAQHVFHYSFPQLMMLWCQLQLPLISLLSLETPQIPSLPNILRLRQLDLLPSLLPAAFRISWPTLGLHQMLLYLQDHLLYKQKLPSKGSDQPSIALATQGTPSCILSLRKTHLSCTRPSKNQSQQHLLKSKL